MLPVCPAPPCAVMKPFAFNTAFAVGGPKAWLGGLGLLFHLGLMASLIALSWRVFSVLPSWNGPDDAIRLLRERYARGDIDDEEFGRRLAALR